MTPQNFSNILLGLSFQRKLFQYSQYFIQAIKKPNWFLMFVLSRVALVRRFAILLSKRPFTQSDEKEPSLFEQLDVDSVTKILKKNDFSLNIKLPEKTQQDIQDFAKNAIYFGDGNPNFCFLMADKEKLESKCGKKIRFAYNFNSSWLCPAIKQVENDPKLWEIAAKYLETNSVLISSQIWWAFAIEEAVNQPRLGGLRFHYDLEGYSSLKFMFYLTDVDSSSSCHICVKGSHKKKKLREQFSLSRNRDDQYIINY